MRRTDPGYAPSVEEATVHDHQPSRAHGHGPEPNLNRLAVSATTHCLTGCAIGEIVGMVIATALGWGNLAQIALAVGLAYLFGFGLTALPLIKAGLAAGTVVSTALAADTVSITIMEVIDNAPCSSCRGRWRPESTTAPVRQRRARLCGRLPVRFLGQPLHDRPGQGPRGRPRVPLAPQRLNGSLTAAFHERYGGVVPEVASLLPSRESGTLNCQTGGSEIAALAETPALCMERSAFEAGARFSRNPVARQGAGRTTLLVQGGALDEPPRDARKGVEARLSTRSRLPPR